MLEIGNRQTENREQTEENREQKGWEQVIEILVTGIREQRTGNRQTWNKEQKDCKLKAYCKKHCRGTYIRGNKQTVMKRKNTRIV